MSTDQLLAYGLFALVTSVTPGPNNLMLLASGVNFGFRRSLFHILGISLGLLVMLVAVGAGLAAVFARLPWIYAVLKWAGAAYMLYLAWRIATSAAVVPAGSGTELARPMPFLGAAAFQWVNPKAWAMCVGAFSAYVPASSGLPAVTAWSLLFAAINLPSVSLWALFGAGMGRLLAVRRTRIVFNCAMALLLVLSLGPLLRAS